ncbi:MAG: YcnI family protein [Sporichthyaceae bacterium]
MRRIAQTLALTAAALGVLAVPASAHVTVSPNSAVKGGYATLAFKVPNERPDASTSALQVDFPEAYPFASISVQPKDGWTYKVEKASLATPISNHGTQVNERVSRITWTANGAEDQIKPGEFDTFPVSAGPLPKDAAGLTFKAIQTYSSGEVVRWIEEAAPGAEEPKNPAPKLTLTDPPAASPSPAPTEIAVTSTALKGPTKDQVNVAIGFGIAGTVLGLVGLAAATVGRRRT